MPIPKTFRGYKRENGRVGVRNYVIILPVDDISNACAESIGNNIKGTVAIPHSYSPTSKTGTVTKIAPKKGIITDRPTSKASKKVYGSPKKLKAK